MGLSAWLRKRAAIVPLIVTVPGGTGARLAVERVVRENGWRAAQNPAAANLVIVAGTAAADFEAYLLRLMATVPEPHARVDIAEGDDVEAKLTAAVRRMRSTDSGQANADANSTFRATTDTGAPAVGRAQPMAITSPRATLPAMRIRMRRAGTTTAPVLLPAMTATLAITSTWHTNTECHLMCPAWVMRPTPSIPSSTTILHRRPWTPKLKRRGMTQQPRVAMTIG